MMRLDKYLGDILNITRSNAKRIIKDHQITINQQAISDPSYLVKDDDIVCFGAQQLKYQKYCYLKMHKPSGYLCATSDPIDPTIIDLVPKSLKRKDLKIVGRLDKDTEGLIILSNDGAFIHKLTSPKKDLPKTYYLEYSGTLKEDASKDIASGLKLSNYQAKPGIFQILGDNKATLTITEGKYHQVKEMIEAVGGKVVYLKRIKIGQLELSDLPKGMVQPLTEAELAQLKER